MNAALKKTLAAVVLVAAGLAAAIALAPAARAWNPDDLTKLNYSTTVVFLDPAGQCREWRASGFGANVNLGSDCDADFPTRLNAFLDGHDERKLAYDHPAAAAARDAVRGKGYDVTTDYAGPTFTVKGGCNIDQTIDAAGLVALNTTLPAAAPCPPVTTALPPPPPPACSNKTDDDKDGKIDLDDPGCAGPTDNDETDPAAPLPPPPAPVTTVITTATETVTVTIATASDLDALQRQIDELRARVDDLNTRVIALEKAGQVTVFGYPDGYAPAGAEYQPNPFA